MTTIRTFQNRDLPELLKVWQAHWSSLGPTPKVNSHRLEQAILSGRFFDPRTLVIALRDQVVCGWSHFLIEAGSSTLATIASFSVLPGVDAAVGQSLMEYSLDQMSAAGVRTVMGGVARDDTHGYAGLEPIGHGIGIPSHDEQSTSLFRTAGFVPLHSFTRLIAATGAYRPPVSREALQLRRSASAHFHSVVPGDLRRASGLSHIDVQRHQLIDRGGKPLAEADFWFSDPEAEVLCPSLAILDLREAHRLGELTSAESYLIASVCQSLAGRNVDRVETAIDSSLKTLLQQLEKICFEPSETGVQWQKSL